MARRKTPSAGGKPGRPGRPKPETAPVVSWIEGNRVFAQRRLPTIKIYVITILRASRLAATPAMTYDNQLSFDLPSVSRKKVTAAFDGGRL
jgi:hypothetical protein